MNYSQAKSPPVPPELLFDFSATWNVALNFMFSLLLITHPSNNHLNHDCLPNVSYFPSVLLLINMINLPATSSTLLRKFFNKVESQWTATRNLSPGWSHPIIQHHKAGISKSQPVDQIQPAICFCKESLLEPLPHSFIYVYQSLPSYY